MPEETDSWDKKKFLDEMVQTMYGTTMTYREYYDSHPHFRQTIDRIHAACEEARASGDPDSVAKLTKKLKEIADEIRGREKQ